MVQIIDTLNTDTNIRMNTNDANGKLIFAELSYTLTGICYDVHNRHGRYAREKQYCDSLEEKLKELSIPYKREHTKEESGNRVDFLIDDKIILEVKAKRFLLKEDYYQLQRYLQSCDKKLGLLVNFRNRYLKPKRIVRIDTSAKSKFA